MTDTPQLDEIDPCTPEGALLYAEHYWKFGNEPRSQAALHVLREQVRQRDEVIERVRHLCDNPKDAHYPVVARSDLRAALDGGGR